MKTAKEILDKVCENTFNKNKQEYVFFSTNERYTILEAMEEYANQFIKVDVDDPNTKLSCARCCCNNNANCEKCNGTGWIIILKQEII